MIWLLLLPLAGPTDPPCPDLSYGVMVFDEFTTNFTHLAPPGREITTYCVDPWAGPPTLYVPETPVISFSYDDYRGIDAFSVGVMPIPTGGLPVTR